MNIYYKFDPVEKDSFIEKYAGPFRNQFEDKQFDVWGGFLDKLSCASVRLYKYQIMYFLRGIEHEINEQNGCIIIELKNYEYLIDIKNFTPALTDKIADIIGSITFEPPYDFLETTEK